LDDIHELKVPLGNSADVQEVQRRATPEAPASGSELFFGSPNLYSLQQVLCRYLPPKVDADRYLSVYLQGDIFIVPFIHTQHFKRQYKEFWADPVNVYPF
jgi:hypothetical protein